jgi:hypothetical protein
VHANILEDWLGVELDEVLGAKFEKAGVMKA